MSAKLLGSRSRDATSCSRRECACVIDAHTASLPSASSRSAVSPTSDSQTTRFGHPGSKSARASSRANQDSESRPASTSQAASLAWRREHALARSAEQLIELCARHFRASQVPFPRSRAQRPGRRTATAAHGTRRTAGRAPSRSGLSARAGARLAPPSWGGGLKIIGSHYIFS